MDTRRLISGVVLSITLFGWIAAGWAAPGSPRLAGELLSVDRAASRIVVGDMGPRLGDGSSDVARRTIRVTPATEFVFVKRATGAAPSDWAGGYVESALAWWDVRPGDFVSVSIRPGDGDPQALEITVVDPGDR